MDGEGEKWGMRKKERGRVTGKRDGERGERMGVWEEEKIRRRGGGGELPSGTCLCRSRHRRGADAKTDKRAISPRGEN